MTSLNDINFVKKASKKVIDQDITQHAEKLHQFLSLLVKKHESGSIKDYDLVGLFILICLSIKQPKRWLGGLLRPSVIESTARESTCDGVRIDAVDSQENRLDVIHAPQDDINENNDTQFSEAGPVSVLYPGPVHNHNRCMTTSTSEDSESPAPQSTLSQGSGALNSLSVRLNSIPDAIKDAIDIRYIYKKLSKRQGSSDKEADFYDLSIEWSVMDVFNLCQFNGIKKNTNNYINISMILWCLNKRPFELLFYIPSPMQVLRQQAEGRRVITLFVSYEELLRKHQAMLYYMAGHDIHERDCFEFTLHDLKHMELFIHRDIHLEQVGFFRCMMLLGHPIVLEALRAIYDTLLDKYQYFTQFVPSMSEKGLVNQFSSKALKDPVIFEASRGDKTLSMRPKGLFLDVLGLDERLWHELEYVISDMNCYSTHLIRYLFAKIALAIERKECSQKDSIPKNTSADDGDLEMKIHSDNEYRSETKSDTYDIDKNTESLNMHAEDHGLEGKGDRNDSTQSKLIIFKETLNTWFVISIGLGLSIDPFLEIDIPESTNSYPKYEMISPRESSMSALTASMIMVNTAFSGSQAMTEMEGESLRNYFKMRAVDCKT